LNIGFEVEVEFAVVKNIKMKVVNVEIDERQSLKQQMNRIKQVK